MTVAREEFCVQNVHQHPHPHAAKPIPADEAEQTVAQAANFS